mgnify:CR=1 FL=1
MNLPDINIRYDGWVVLLSFLIASLASYVALDLAKRVRTHDRVIAVGWWAAGSVTMGTGIWAMHFIGMLALKLPFAVGYDYAITALSWFAGVAVSAIALHVAGYRRLTPLSLCTGALVMGAGICAMHYTGMHALKLAPGIRWDVGWVTVSVVIAVVASAVALMFTGLTLANVLGVRIKKLSGGGFDHSNTVYVLGKNGVIAHRQDGLGQDPAGTLQAVHTLLQ